LGSIRIRKDGKIFRVPEDATASEVKRLLGLPPDSKLISARNEMIDDNERITDKIYDGESVAAVPSYKYW